MSYIVNVRPDLYGSGSNKIEVKLPEKEYMILTERDVPEDYEDTGVDPCLYYAVERISELEAYKKNVEDIRDSLKVKDLTTNNGDIRADAEWRAGWNRCINELFRLIGDMDDK